MKPKQDKDVEEFNRILKEIRERRSVVNETKKGKEKKS